MVVVIGWVISFLLWFTVNASGLHCICALCGGLSVVIVWLGLLVVDCCVRFCSCIVYVCGFVWLLWQLFCLLLLFGF